LSAGPDLTPSLQALLDGPARWHTIDLVEEVGSTNDVAVQRIREGFPPGLVVVAERQTAGRGRRGRTWESAPPGATSLLVTATSVAPAIATLVPLAAGLAVRAAARRVGARVDLKWPNDAVVGASKCAGVLVEYHEGVVAVGIGIDVDWRGADRSGQRMAWTSLAEAAGRDVDRLEVLAHLLGGLDTWLNDVERDPQTMLALYRQACVTIGREVVVTTPSDTEVRGRATVIEATGALVVETADGRVAIDAGDVTHLR